MYNRKLLNNQDRLNDYINGIEQLPDIDLINIEAKNGEELATDEAAVWKRVLNYRIASSYVNLNNILETHRGLGIGTYIYKMATNHKVKIVSLDKYKDALELDNYFDIIDIDPFGQPYDAINSCLHLINKNNTVLMVSNGEALAVWRNLKKQQFLKTDNYGKKMVIWVIEEYLPYLEKVTGLKVRFYYVFPTTVRTILSNLELPKSIFDNCPRLMWWLKKYYEDTGTYKKIPLRWT